MRSTPRRPRRAAIVAVVVSLLVIGRAADADAVWKVAHWNVQSGYGKAGWEGTATFKPGSNCAVNAWGGGAGPLAKTLIAKVKNDAAVVALTLNEAWTCATPRRIQALLGWPAVAPATTTGEIAGVGIVARYGFAGKYELKALPRCVSDQSAADQRYVVRVPVYVNSARTKVANVHATHWRGCAAEATATADFMQQKAYTPRTLTGDFNITDPTGSAIRALEDRNYKDAWATVKGTTVGNTSTWNNSSGSPKGNLYKRIDYAFFKTLTVVSVALFNHTSTPGTAVQADHAGLVVGYADLP